MQIRTQVVEVSEPLAPRDVAPLIGSSVNFARDAMRCGAIRSWKNGSKFFTDIRAIEEYRQKGGAGYVGR